MLSRIADSSYPMTHGTSRRFSQIGRMIEPADLAFATAENPRQKTREPPLSLRLH